ncbi:MAG: IMP dehydrogenase, partial [Candidatus Liptonbacteria bacterium]|nr:IMP dehydrogenase [Candidatus Liptonbacteria bacterium]
EVEAQAEKGIAALLIDTARACSVNTEEAVRQIKKRFKLPLIVGNVSTALGAKYLFEWGADAVKVNQGRGHVCRTSEIGVGTPQITAIAECKAIAEKYGGSVIGDGGMKSPGDMVKALIAGADVLMTGYHFIRTRESAAPLQFNKDGLPIKIYEGSASFAAQAKRIDTGTLDRIRRPEGVAEEVVVTGTVAEELEDILNGFRSAMSYLGVRSLAELRTKGVLKLQTPAGHFEGIKKA